MVADNGGGFEQLVMHFDPRAMAEVGPTYQDLFQSFPSSTEIDIVVEKAEDFDTFHTLLRTWNIERPERFHPIVIGKQITTWSRDRYTLMRRGDERYLLSPPRPVDGHIARQNDWWAPFAVAKAHEEVDVEVADLIFEGGDFVATKSYVFATALLRRRNEGGELYDERATRKWIERHAGKKVILLGENISQIPEHHIGMFVTPIDDTTILVGDPDLGLSLLPKDAELPFPVARDKATLDRFRYVATRLEELGFTIVRMPLVPLSDGLTYITYNNALLERRRDGKLHAYVPQFGMDELDRKGRRAYEEQGIVVHPINVQRIYRHNGTVRCLVNVLKRATL